MKFYVILTASSSDWVSVSQFKQKGLEQTEKKDCHPYTYLDGWKLGNHFKQVGILDKVAFDEMICDCGLYFEYVETMGMLTGDGHLPAFSFTSCLVADPCRIINAYVCPIPEDSKGEDLMPNSEEQANKWWGMIRGYFKAKY